LPIQIETVRTDVADIWVAWDGVQENAYAYGGCRLVGWRAPMEEVIGLLCVLMSHESGYKNTLINLALRQGALQTLDGELPAGFAGSRVGGARCVIRPAGPSVAAVLGDPGHPAFRDTVSQVMEPLGALLNRLEGRVKLTPDFGRYAGVADLLHQFTPHVLGIDRRHGGCGGKSTYSAAGVIAAYQALERRGTLREPDVLLIGSAGAMGRVVLDHLLEGDPGRVAVCDLRYERGEATPPAGVTCLAAEPRRFSDDCLGRSGCLIATTWGGELERSDWRRLPPGNVVLLAHNLALPSGSQGVEIARELGCRSVLVIPGQVLTLGGALTSRLEWFSRRAGTAAFDKPLARRVVAAVVGHWTDRLVGACDLGSGPYEAMLDACDPQLAVAG
jgi:hypothetical protein